MTGGKVESGRGVGGMDSIVVVSMVAMSTAWL